MTGLIGAWIAAIVMGWLGEAQGKRGAALISLLGFMAVSGGVIVVASFEPLTAARLMIASPELAGAYALLTSPLSSMLIAGGVVWAVFGPFVVMIEATAKPAPPSPAPETWRKAAERREPEV